MSHVRAHTGPGATAASEAMNAEAYATGNHVAFAGTPSLHTAAHEAAHVIQQRAGVHLKGGVGEAGDSHERHADAVADRVVRGESSEELLDQYRGSGGGGGGGELQLKLKYTSDDVMALHPTRFSFTKAAQVPNPKYQSADSQRLFEAIVRALDDYHRAKTPEQEMQLLRPVVDACLEWRDNHLQEKQNAQALGLISHVIAAAKDEMLELDAQANMARYNKAAQENYVEAYRNEEMSMADSKAAAGISGGARTLASGGDIRDEERLPGVNEAAMAEVNKYGLTEAEILAIRIYSSAEYKLINPGVAQSDSWLNAMMGRAVDPEEAKGMKLAGATHAGVLLSALNKLPVKEGILYRGGHLSPEEFEQQFQKGQTVTRAAFSSCSREVAAARKFMNEKYKAGNIKYLCTIRCTNGRSLENLSALGFSEAEWLLLPGATFQIVDVQGEGLLRQVGMVQMQ